jgi:hypothetical protein
MNELLGSVGASCGLCARIKLQAMPYAMSLFCTGFTYIWLLLLPFGVFPEASWSALLPVFMMVGRVWDVGGWGLEGWGFGGVEARVRVGGWGCGWQVGEGRRVRGGSLHQRLAGHSRDLNAPLTWPRLPSTLAAPP